MFYKTDNLTCFSAKNTVEVLSSEKGVLGVLDLKKPELREATISGGTTPQTKFRARIS